MFVYVSVSMRGVLLLAALAAAAYTGCGKHWNTALAACPRVHAQAVFPSERHGLCLVCSALCRTVSNLDFTVSDADIKVHMYRNTSLQCS